MVLDIVESVLGENRQSLMRGPATDADHGSSLLMQPRRERSAKTTSHAQDQPTPSDRIQRRQRFRRHIQLFHSYVVCSHHRAPCSWIQGIQDPPTPRVGFSCCGINEDCSNLPSRNHSPGRPLKSDEGLTKTSTRVVVDAGEQKDLRGLVGHTCELS